MKKVYLVTGFLGAGKTTLLNNLAKVLEKEKTAFVVNEFGKAGVDGKILSSGKIKIKEISNGSIFCSCKSGDFIDALVKLNEYDLSHIFIETSGFSDPRDMNKVMSTVNKLIDNTFEYMGMITLVQSSNLYKLINTVNAIRGQIINSDLIIINKIDITEKEDLERTIDEIRKYNQDVKIIKTSFAKVDIEIIKDLKKHSVKNENYEPSKKDLTLQKLHFDLPKKISVSKLENMIRKIAKDTYRIKGFLKDKDKSYYIDCVSDDIKIDETDSKIENDYLVILGKNLDKVNIFLKKNLKPFY